MNLNLAKRFCKSDISLENLHDTIIDPILIDDTLPSSPEKPPFVLPIISETYCASKWCRG